MMRKFGVPASLIALALVATVASAQEIKVGLSGTFTGQNASNGIPYRNAAELFPTSIAGTPVKWILLDDETDPSKAAKNARKFVEEDKVDVILGSTSSGTAAAMEDIAIASGTVQIALAPINITSAKAAWIFCVPQPVPIMVSAIVADMKKKGFSKIAFIGYSDGWGDQNWTALSQAAKSEGIKIVDEERYNRTDTSVIAQVLKVIALEPDAVFVGASGTAAALPQTTLKDQGFGGVVYQTHGTVVQAFINVAGKAAEGAIMPTGPIVAATQLPDDNPTKKVSQDFIEKYEAKWGKGSVSPIAGYAWDAMLLIQAAVPQALAKAKPGTPEFRAAIRDALQAGKDVTGTNAVYHYTPDDHYGVDQRSRVLVVVKDGKFALIK